MAGSALWGRLVRWCGPGSRRVPAVRTAAVPQPCRRTAVPRSCGCAGVGWGGVRAGAVCCGSGKRVSRKRCARGVGVGGLRAGCMGAGFMRFRQDTWLPWSVVGGASVPGWCCWLSGGRAALFRKGSVVRALVPVSCALPCPSCPSCSSCSSCSSCPFRWSCLFRSSCLFVCRVCRSVRSFPGVSVWCVAGGGVRWCPLGARPAGGRAGGRVAGSGGVVWLVWWGAWCGCAGASLPGCGVFYASFGSRGAAERSSWLCPPEGGRGVGRGSGGVFLTCSFDALMAPT